MVRVGYSVHPQIDTRHAAPARRDLPSDPGRTSEAMPEKRAMKWIGAVLGVLVFYLLLALWHQHASEDRSAPVAGDQVDTVSGNEPIRPIPLTLGQAEKKVALGARLFRDPLLSRDGGMSCVTCHDPRTGGTDGLAHSVGVGEHARVLDTPTVLNAGFNFRQLSDGRAETLEDQVDDLMHGRGATWDEVVTRLRASGTYRSAFDDLYGDGPQRASVKDAVAEFVRSLYTPNSRFDRSLRGDNTALTGEEAEGYRLFKTYGCASCHQGVNIGGNMFARRSPPARSGLGDPDGVTAGYGDPAANAGRPGRGLIKVPSLRNVALTSPYFHDGSAESLESAVSTMGRHRLARTLSREEIDLLVKFLRTLTGATASKSL